VILAINGPIASGKSTLAKAVARELRRRGRTAAVVDLDLVYEMLADDPKDDPHVWTRARAAADALANALPVDVVIIDGEPLRADRIVALSVSLDEAIRRAQLDPTRGRSRDPEFLRAHHVENPGGLDTTLLGIEECACRIADYAV
jgi:chloramphenicol 3-O-phosphotransferase